MNESRSGARKQIGATGRVVFVNRYFAPDISATSQLLSDLAFHLASRGQETHVVCGDALYADCGERLPEEEVINEVHVHRVADGRFGRSMLVGRAVDYIGLYASLRRRLSALLKAGDILVVKTDPPLLTIALAGLARKKRAQFIPWLQDLYPEVAAALNVPFLNGPAVRPLAKLRDRSLRSADAVVTIGSRMRDHVTSRGVAADRVHVIPNWADDESVVPIAQSVNELRAEWGLTSKFVVGYSGNLGRAHEYQTLIGAAERLKDREDIAFLIVGGGHHMDRLREDVRLRGLKHLFHFHPYQERALLSQSLSASDLHWLSLRPELEGLIVPSKLYGIAAAGRALINVGAQDGEVAEIIKRFGCGVTILPGDGAAMASAILRFLHSPDDLEHSGQRARLMAEQYSKARAMERWERLIGELCEAVRGDR